MRYLLTVAASAAVTFFLVQLSNESEAKLIYEQGFKAGLAQRPRYNMDTQCTAWFFNSNLRDAKMRICGKRS